jgi:hypothetical protein
MSTFQILTGTIPDLIISNENGTGNEMATEMKYPEFSKS